MVIVEINSIDKLGESAKQFWSEFKTQHFFLFYGEMGSGKTTFITALCKELKTVDPVNSPTFSIVNEYLTENNKKIYHFDFYRINKVQEIMNIGFDDYVANADYIFIEWPEIAENFYNDDFTKIKISVQNDHSRLIELL